MHSFTTDLNWSFLSGRTVESLLISSTVVNLSLDTDIHIQILHEFELLSIRNPGSRIDRLARAGELSVLVGQQIVGAETESATALKLTFSGGIQLRLLTESGPYECLVIDTKDRLYVF